MAIVDAASGDTMLPIFEPQIPGSIFYQAAFSPDGRELVAVIQVPDSTDESNFIAEFRRWDANTGQPSGATFQLPKVPNGWWDTFTFSPNLQWLLAGGYFGGNVLVDLATGRPVNGLKPGKRAHHLAGHNDLISTIAFSPDARYVVTGSSDQTVRIWDTVRLEEVRQLRGHTTAINDIAWSSDGRWIATAAGGTLRIWEAGTTLEQDNSPTLPGMKVSSVSRDGSRILMLGNPMTLLDADTKRSIQTFDVVAAGFDGNMEHGLGSDISPDGRLVLIIWHQPGPRLLVWDVASGRPLFPLKIPANMDGADNARFSPDSRLIVTTTGAKIDRNGMVRLWSAETGELVRELDHHTATVHIAAFTPDGQRLVTGASDSHWIPNHDPQHAGIRVWNVADGREFRRMTEIDSKFTSMAFSPDGIHLAVGMEKLAVVKVFDFETGQERITLTGHRDYVKSVAYSPDGRRILTVSNDETAKLWDAESGRERLNFDLHSKYARAGFLLHGRCIVTSSWEDGTRFYDAATPEQVATWETDSQAQR